MLAPVADCEARDGGFWQQDVNAFSSLAYVAVGVALVAAVVRGRLPRSILALALVTSLEGVGSVLFHGSSGDLAQALHDLSLIGMLGYVAGWHAGRLTGRHDQGALVGVATAIVIGAAIWSVSASATNAIAGVGVAVIVAAEVLARRRGLAGVWGVPLLVLAALAGVAWLGGTPDSPLCDADSWLQLHGVWHLLSAVIVLVWVDAAQAAARPLHPPRLWRRGTDRLLGLLTLVLAHAFHRSVEVIGRERVPRDRPVLVVANHGNGFVDPIVVASVLGRLPRFLAKAALWKVVPARPLLALAGVLPVYRSGDGDTSSKNASTFAACHHELALGATVAIFPEGTTGDRGGLDRVRSGAARIALDAPAAVVGLVLVPIGLAFESRVDTRSRTVVMVGEPIDVDQWVMAHPDLGEGGSTPGDAAHARVDALTGAIAAALADVSPDYESVDERELARASARTVLRADRSRGEPSFGEVELAARRLAMAPADDRNRVVAAFRRYASSLYLVGLRDCDLRATPSSWARLAASVAAVAFIGSLVATITLIHLPAVAVVLVATGWVRSTATKGTVRMLVGLVAGLATWIVAGIVLADGVAAIVAGAAVALGGALALAVWSPLVRAAGAVVGRVRARNRAGLLAPLLDERAAVVDAFRAALEARPDPHGDGSPVAPSLVRRT